MRAVINKCKERAETLHLLEKFDGSESIIGLVISQIVSKVDGGGIEKYLVGYVDDNGDRRVMALKFIKAKRCFSKSVFVDIDSDED